MCIPFPRLAISSLVAVAAMLGTAQAKDDVPDGYWRTHWNWYDSTYRPYYHYRYYTPGYVYPSHPVPYFGWSPYYTPPPVRSYADPLPGEHVVRFGWW